MTLFAFIVFIIGASSAVPLYVLINAIRIRLKTGRVKQNGVEAEASVLHIELLNEHGRCIPFVKMQVTVGMPNGNRFIGSVTSFIRPEEIPGLTACERITVRYNPFDISQIQVVKKEAAVRKSDAHPLYYPAPVQSPKPVMKNVCG